MPFPANRVREYTFTTGTGNLTMGGAYPGFLTAATECVSGEAYDYYLEIPGTSTFEGGSATYLGAGVFARTTILVSSTGAVIDLPAGTKIFTLGISAETLDTVLRVGRNKLLARDSTGAVEDNPSQKDITDFGLSLVAAADAAAAAALLTVQGAPGGFGLRYLFDAATSGSPAATYLRLNDTPAAATEIVVADADRYIPAAGVIGFLAAGDIVNLFAEPTSAKQAAYTVVSVAPGTGIYTITVTPLTASATAFTAGDKVAFSVIARGAQGPQGSQGAQGTQGGQGGQGAQGSQGPQGAQGGTGAAGPQGPQGGQGSQGAQGSQGSQGEAGSAGPQGAQGTQGNQGTQGAQGAQGAQGVQGSQGTQGNQGSQGSQGAVGGYTLLYAFDTATTPTPATGGLRYDNTTPASVTKLYASKTDRNGTTVTGVLDDLAAGDRIKVFADADATKWAVFAFVSQTNQTDDRTLTVTYVGSQNSVGNGSACAMTVSKIGPQGTQGVQGVQGSQGAQGNQGAAGAAGSTGPQGEQGNQGAQGVQGAQGTQGFQGAQGAQGAQGNQGTQGSQGNQGNQGAQGSQGAQGVTTRVTAYYAEFPAATVTHTILSGSKFLRLTGVSPGGSGGGGRRGASGTARGGGSGGGGGQYFDILVPVSSLGGTALDIFIPRGPSGGAGATVNATDGANGSAPAYPLTVIDQASGRYLANVYGGNGGAGGIGGQQTTVGIGASGWAGNGGNGGQGYISTAGLIGTNGGAGGGGGGGGVTNSGNQAGNSGGPSQITWAGSVINTDFPFGGSGGLGGNGPGGNGSDGNNYGGGGGGGAGNTNGANGGTGGAGGQGILVVTEY